MDHEIDINILKDLSEADGIGGREKEVSRVVRKYGEAYCDEFFYDNFGSIILVKKCGKPNAQKIMFSAHMDEVGFMVRNITPDGFLKLLPVGGWWGHVMPAQEMRVTTACGDKYAGVVGSRAPHGMEKKDKDKVIAPMEFYLDMGVSNAEAIRKLGIEIGDMVTPNTAFCRMNDPDYLMGKAWDDRVCVGVLLEVLKNISSLELDADVYFTASTQEEVGIRGARTAVHAIKPDLAIALDVTTAKDTPFDNGGLKLGGGVVLAVLDSLTIGNAGLVRRMEDIAKAHQLDLNHDFMTVGGTDACNIHKALEGVVAMTVSIPTRYMHSSRLLIHRKDYAQTISLLTEFLKETDFAEVAGFKSAVGVE